MLGFPKMNLVDDRLRTDTVFYCLFSCHNLFPFKWLKWFYSYLRVR
jgi:hypothetical protein